MKSIAIPQSEKAMDECGVFGFYNNDGFDSVAVTHEALYGLQHRGQISAGITVNEDRKKTVDFSVPYVRTGIVFVFAKDTPYEKGEDAKGKRIGVQNGTTSADYVREKLGQEPEMFDSPASAFAALKQGKVDVVIADVDPAKNLVKNEPDYDVSDLLTVEEYAVAIKKGQPELLATVNKVIEALEDSGKLDEIKEEHTARAANLSSAE